MREVLEELKLTELYDDAIYLAHYHGGPKPPKFTQEQLNELRIMFKQVKQASLSSMTLLEQVRSN